MLNFCGIVVAILKMETGKKISRSGIISGRWNRTMLNLCGIVEAILKMATGRNVSMSWINWGHHNLPTYEMSLISVNVEFCGIVEDIFKMVTGRNFPILGINSGHHYLPTYKILMISDNVEFLTPIFYAVFLAAIFKMADISKFWKCRIAPLMVTYHYVKFYGKNQKIPHCLNNYKI